MGTLCCLHPGLQCSMATPLLWNRRKKGEKTVPLYQASEGGFYTHLSISQHKHLTIFI